MHNWAETQSQGDKQIGARRDRMSGGHFSDSHVSPARSSPPGRVDERPQVENVGSQVLSLRQLSRRVFSSRPCWQLSRVAAGISKSDPGLPTGITAQLFFEASAFLRTSVLRAFDTVLRCGLCRAAGPCRAPRAAAARGQLLYKVTERTALAASPVLYPADTELSAANFGFFESASCSAT
jgi:hypothetical protein